MRTWNYTEKWLRASREAGRQQTARFDPVSKPMRGEFGRHQQAGYGPDILK
jgi:hypothetical protein